MAVMGLSVMSLEIMTIILFQIQLGSAYSQMGLLITAFMLGMAGGSYLTPRFIADYAGARRLSLICQVGLCCITGLSGVWLPTLAHLQYLGLEGWGQLIFMMFLLIVGGLGGGLFASLAEVLLHTGTRPGLNAGVLYAADLLGATLGTLGMSLLALPIFGLRPTLLLLAALHLSAGVVLLSTCSPRFRHNEA
jgi:spermidine synthase